jgi:DNA-binding transcriptional ArsR family regulator
MTFRTPQLLEGLASDEALEVVIALLAGGRTVGDLVKATGFNQPMVSRRVTALQMASLVDKVGRKGAVELRNAAALRQFLLAASELAGTLAGGDVKDEADFRRRLGDADAGV